MTAEGNVDLSRSYLDSPERLGPYFEMHHRLPEYQQWLARLSARGTFPEVEQRLRNLIGGLPDDMRPDVEEYLATITEG